MKDSCSYVDRPENVIDIKTAKSFGQKDKKDDKVEKNDSSKKVLRLKKNKWAWLK